MICIHLYAVSVHTYMSMNDVSVLICGKCRYGSGGTFVRVCAVC